MAGSNNFIINYNNGQIVIQNRSRSRIILDDYDVVSEETVFIDGSRDIEAKGQYFNPKIIMRKTDYSEWQNKLKPLFNKIVNFTPFADNSPWNFNCKVVSVLPLFEKGLHWKDYVEIQLRSTEYMTTVYDPPEPPEPPSIPPNAPAITRNSEFNTILMTCSTEGAVIYFTFGSTAAPVTPNNSNTQYTSALPYNSGWYKAIAYKNGLYSTVTTVKFNALPAMPKIRLIGQMVCMSCDTAGAVIYYTCSNNCLIGDPNNASDKYIAPLPLEYQYYKAIAYKDGEYSTIAWAMFHYLPPVTVMDNRFFLGDLITPPVIVTDNRFFLGDYLPVEPPTITHNQTNNTIEIT